ncbi:hypothetical protein NSERKGN1266_73860 [Nocardia seriolae]|nr:hypothetical protein NSERKGN1266_73860 [Nocardia seriolae]
MPNAEGVMTTCVTRCVRITSASSTPTLASGGAMTRVAAGAKASSVSATQMSKFGVVTCSTRACGPPL